MKKLLLIASVAIIGFASCQKGKPILQHQNNQALVRTLAYNVNDLLITGSPANPNNPYDSVVFLHDQICILTQNIWDQSGFSLEDSQELHELYTAELNAVHDANDTTISFSNFQSFLNEILVDSSISYIDFINQSDFSTLAKSYAIQLYSKFDSMDEDSSFNSYIASFVTVETQIENDNNLVDSEKEMLLKTASIFRFSSVLWTNMLYNDLGGTAANLIPMIANGSGGGNLWQKIKAFIKKHKKQILAAVKADVKAIPSAKGSSLMKTIEVAAASTAGYVSVSKK